MRQSNEERREARRQRALVRQAEVAARREAMNGGPAIDWNDAGDTRHVQRCMSAGGFPTAILTDGRTLWIWPTRWIQGRAA